MDSTRAIIRLWRLCSPADVGPQVGGDGALHVDLLKAVLDRELQDKIPFLDGGSVDDVMWRYMQPDGSGVVGFLAFWRGMEQILQACGAHRNCLGTAQTHAIDGFRFLRECVLEMAPSDTAQGRSVFLVSELRYFIERTTHVAGPEGANYWQHQADLLPEDHIYVTGEEVSSALLAWLEDLVEPEDGDEAAEDLEDSADEGAIASTRLEEGESEESEDDDSEDEEHARLGREGLWLPVPSPQLNVAPPPRLPLSVSSGAGRGVSKGSSSGVGAQRTVSPLECSLNSMLERYERRPPSPTKVLASEWRDSAEFHVALTRWLAHLQANREELTLAAFHNFTRDHVRKVRRRTNERSVSPRMRSLCCTKGVQVFFTALNGLRVKRLEAGWGALLAARRHGRRSSTQQAHRGTATVTAAGDFDIFSELLKAQCQTALVLENRVKVAGKAGTLAFAIARLLRTSLRGAWMQWGDWVGSLPERPARTPTVMAWMQKPSARSQQTRDNGMGQRTGAGGGRMSPLIPGSRNS